MIFPWAKLALAGGIFVAGLLAGLWFQDGRVDRAKQETAIQVAAVQQRDETIRLLEQANKDLATAIGQQNASITELAQASQEGQKQALEALEKARATNRTTATKIAALTAKIATGTGANCADAIAEVRAGL